MLADGRFSAGEKADATRVIGLYRRAFDNDAKRLARSRSIEALIAAGCTTVVCLWGGGLDAEELVAAGFRVIAVDNGSMGLADFGRTVSVARKRRALKLAAETGGYEWRWGDVNKFMGEADGALLDFHGPWSKGSRKAVRASRHMKATVVTLTPSHDLSTDATSALERQMAYQVFLRLAWSDRPPWESVVQKGPVRRLTDYHEDQGRTVFVYLLSAKRVHLPRLTETQRSRMRRDIAERLRRRGRTRWANLSVIEKRDQIARQDHSKHLRSGIAPRRPCPICQALRIVACGICGDPVTTVRGKYCSTTCVKEGDRRARMRWRLKAAAVSGTAAEAVSSENLAA